MRYKIASIAHLFRLPSYCILCNQSHRGLFAVCNDCDQLLIPLGTACQYCAMPLPDDSFLVCGKCCKEKPAFDQATARYLYTEPLKTLLHDFKYKNGLYLSNFLANNMLQEKPIDFAQAQCLIPVPMHSARLRQRGFNQAVELTKHLAKALKLPYDLSHCKKIINTAPQARLNANQRQKNLNNAFQAQPLPYQHIMLIDDLLTTGSTADALARTLKAQGVKRVDLWCCARVVKID